MDLGLRDRRALVTAASRGLGRASASALAGEGARVFVCSRNAEDLARTASEIGAVGHVAADLSQAGEPERVVQAAVEALGGLDILVCNNGGPPPGTFESTAVDDWQIGYGLTLMSAVRLIKAALEHLKQSGRGRIVNITSISVRQPIANIVQSNSYRSAVTAMAKTLALEVARFGVTVNNLAPGTILTDRVRQLHGENLAGAVEGIPAGRLGEPDELGAACAFLCSRQAGYITGQTLGIDGGALKGVY